MDNHSNSADQTVQLTQAGYDKLLQELTELNDIKIPKAIERVAEARSKGDLRENSEYHAAREELAMLEGKRDELQVIVDRAEIITKSNNGLVSVGSEVEVEIKGRDGKHTFHIVGEWEANPAEKKISEKSPLGQALSGKKKGEEVSVEVPAGKLTYKISQVK